MFQMYSHMQRRNAGSEEKKEQETTGHDRFYQERSRYELSVFGEWRKFFVNDAVQLEAKTNKKIDKNAHFLPSCRKKKDYFSLKHLKCVFLPRTSRVEQQRTFFVEQMSKFVIFTEGNIIDGDLDKCGEILS